MRPGEVQRWRLIHAGAREKLTLALAEHQLSVVAYDGITTGRREDQQNVELFPGNRADVLLKADARPGTYKLVWTERGNEVVALIDIKGEAKPMDLPHADQFAEVRHFTRSAECQAVAKFRADVQYSTGQEYDVRQGVRPERFTA